MEKQKRPPTLHEVDLFWTAKYLKMQNKSLVKIIEDNNQKIVNIERQLKEMDKNK